MYLFRYIYIYIYIYIYVRSRVVDAIDEARSRPPDSGGCARAAPLRGSGPRLGLGGPNQEGKEIGDR